MYEHEPVLTAFAIAVAIAIPVWGLLELGGII